MTRPISDIPMDELLPHRGGMSLLSTTLAVGEDSAATRTRISDNCRLFRLPDGRFGSWLVIELMAQTIGVYAGWRNRCLNRPPKIGFLLGTRRMEVSQGFLNEGDEVDVHAECTFFGGQGLPSQFACRAEVNGRPLASANLTVYEPENFDAWKN